MDENKPNDVDTQLTLAISRTKLAAQRNELAAERTFSAWIRTGLSGVGGGLALLEFINFKHPHNIFLADLAGVILILWGIAVTTYALISYYQNCTEFAEYKTVRTGKIAVTAIALVILLLSFIILLITFD